MGVQEDRWEYRRIDGVQEDRWEYRRIDGGTGG